MLIIKSQETQKKSLTPTATKPPPPPPSPLSSDEDSLCVRGSTAAKRPAEDGATKEVKKPRKGFNFLQRIWNDEDEIVILQRMIDHKSMKKSDPMPDMYDFIREKLRFDASRVQLQCKMRKMKSKYEKNKSKEVEGKLIIFSKLHDQKVYNMSEIIWGDESGNGEKAAKKRAIRKVEGDVKKNARVKSEEVKKEAAVVESGGGDKLAAAKRVMSMEEMVLIAGRELYELGKDGVEREEEWQKLRVEELELYQKEMEVKVAQNKVRIAQTKLVLNAIKEGKIAIF